MKNNTYGVLFISGSMLVSGFLSYLYHPLMIRYLSIEDFGSFESILSVMNLFWVLINSLGLFYQKEVAKNIDNLAYSKAYNRIGLYYIGIFASIVCLAFFLCIPFFSTYLDIEYYYFFPLTISILFSFLAITNNSFLKAFKRFKTISLMIASISLIKLIFGFIFIAIGFGIIGALGGFIVSQIIMFSIGYILIRNSFQTIEEERVEKKQILSSFLSQKKQILQYLATSILIALFMNIDILIVKNIFDGETAGYYAAVSVLAKFLVFLGLSIETVYYPQLVKESVLPKVQVLKISVYYLAMTVGAIVFFTLFGEFILRIFKSGLEEYIVLIYALLVYCGLLAYLSVIVKTLIAFERYKINYILGVVMIGLIVSLYSFGTSPLLVTQIFTLFGAIGLVAGLWELTRT